MPRLARQTPAATRRVNVNTKVLPEVRDALQNAAEANGRPLSAEIEHRLRERFASQPDIRTIIREEIEADREQQRKALMERVTAGPYGSACANNLPGLGANYGRSLSYLNGEPKTDH